MFNSSDVNGTQSTSKYEQWYICYQQHIHSLLVLQTDLQRHTQYSIKLSCQILG